MLRHSKQRLAPEPVRRWALRCGAGLLLGAGICAAAAGTAHADAPDLTGPARAAVESLLPAPSTHGTTSAGSSEKPSGKPASASRPAAKAPSAPAVKIIRVAPPKHVAGSVGRHRAPAADEVTRTTRTARTLVDGTLDTVGSLATRGSTPSAGKISGRLTDVVGGTASTHRIGPGVPDLPVLLLPSPELPALRLPGVQLPGVQFPGVQLPGLELPGLSPEFGQPVPVLPGAPVPGLTAGTVAERILAGHHVRFSSTFQGLTGTAPSHLSRVALPDAPSAPAAPRGPRPTGPVPAPPAGTGAGAAVDLTTLWAVPAPIAGLTPSGLSTLVAGRTGPAPRDLAGMPLITPD